MKEKIKIKKGRHYSTVEGEKDESSDTKHIYLAKEKKPVGRWYFNCGKNDFIYVLAFEGDTLKCEETGSYGKGKSDCKCNP